MNQQLVGWEVLQGVRKESNREQMLDFRRADFSLFRKLVSGIPVDIALKGRGVQKSWHFFRKAKERLSSILQAKEQFILVLTKTGRHQKTPLSKQGGEPPTQKGIIQVVEARMCNKRRI